MNLSVGAGHAREIKRRVDLKIWPFPVGAGHAREWKGGIVFPPGNDDLFPWAVPTLLSRGSQVWSSLVLYGLPTTCPQGKHVPPLSFQRS